MASCLRMWSYCLFVLIKLSLVFIHLNGFTNPTDYSHTTEIISGDILKVDHHTSWVFKPTFPTQSITISYLAYGLPIYLFSLFTVDSVYKLEYFQILIKSWVFLLSLLLDYFYYKTSFYMKCSSMSMFLYATYYITYTVAFKPSLLVFETLIFSCLIYFSLYFSVLIQEKRTISGLIPNFIGVLVSIGIFTNISFLYTGLWLFLWPCFWVITRDTRYKLFQLLSFVNQVLVSFILTSLLITTIDSIYFKQLTITYGEQTCHNNLIPSLISSYLVSLLRIRLCVSGRFIFIPYNAVQYYFDKSTEAHNTPTNAIYNILGFSTLFGPVLWLFSYSTYKILTRTRTHLKNLAKLNEQPVVSRIYWIFKIYQFGLILNVLILFVFNFTRAYYNPFALTPLHLPLFLVCGYSLQYYMSKRLRCFFWLAWLIFNSALFVYYGTLYEAGVTKSLATIQSSFINKITGREDCKVSLLPCLECSSTAPCQYNIFYSHTTQPPRHFLLWPETYRSYNVTLSWEREGSLEVLKSKLGQMKEKCKKSQCSILLVTLAADNFESDLHLGKPIAEVFPHFGQGAFGQQIDSFFLSIGVPAKKGNKYNTLDAIRGIFNFLNRERGSLSDKLTYLVEAWRHAFSLRIHQA